MTCFFPCFTQFYWFLHPVLAKTKRTFLTSFGDIWQCFNRFNCYTSLLELTLWMVIFTYHLKNFLYIIWKVTFLTLPDRQFIAHCVCCHLSSVVDTSCWCCGSYCCWCCFCCCCCCYCCCCYCWCCCFLVGAVVGAVVVIGVFILLLMLSMFLLWCFYTVVDVVDVFVVVIGVFILLLMLSMFLLLLLVFLYCCWCCFCCWCWCCVAYL